MGFAFPDYAHVWSALDGELGAFLRGVIDKLGPHAFDKLWDIGFRQIISSTTPIQTPEDLKGFKIRVPISPLWTSLFYTALQTRIVDGQENPLSLILIAKLYEVQKYISITNHMWDGQFTLVNGRTWKALPAGLQEVLARNFNAAVVKEREDLVKLNQSVERELENLGLTFNRTDPVAFRAAVFRSGLLQAVEGNIR